MKYFVKDYINERNIIGISASNPNDSSTENKNQNGLFEPQIEAKVVPGHSRVQSSLQHVNNNGQSHSGDGGNKNFTGDNVGDESSVGKNPAGESAATKLISYIKDMLN